MLIHTPIRFILFCDESCLFSCDKVFQGCLNSMDIESVKVFPIFFGKVPGLFQKIFLPLDIKHISGVQFFVFRFHTTPVLGFLIHVFDSIPNAGFFTPARVKTSMTWMTESYLTFLSPLMMTEALGLLLTAAASFVLNVFKSIFVLSR